jgi:hypothetical protein
MKTWLFPTKDFYKYQMKKAMENHKIIGSNSETTNTLPTELIEKLKQDKDFMDNIKSFKGKGYSNLALQFVDFDTKEVYYNLLIRINDKDLMYFEPMPVSQLPADYVGAQLDVNKLIEIIEFEEKGKVELQSPPWDQRPREEFVKGVVDNVRMYFKFNSFMNTLKVSESKVNSESKFFVQKFFDLLMKGDNQDKGMEDTKENSGGEDKNKAGDKQKKE